jgi:hypothetical protein
MYSQSLMPNISDRLQICLMVVATHETKAAFQIHFLSPGQFRRRTTRFVA